MTKQTIPRYTMRGDPSKGTAILEKRSWVPYLSFSNGYNKVTAYNAALLALLAYEEKERTIEDFFNGLYIHSDSFNPIRGFSVRPYLYEVDHRQALKKSSLLVGNVPETDTQFFAVSSKTQILICFQGTQSIHDWVRNFDATATDFKEIPGVGQVHSGFYGAFLSVKDLLREFIQSNGSSDTQYVLIGHSLGGAIATLMAAYICSSISENVALYTFGSPRAGDSRFARYLSSVQPFVCFRVVNERDPVAMMPCKDVDLHKWLLPLGAVHPGMFLMATKDFDGSPYTHIGQEIYMEEVAESSVVVDASGKRQLYCAVESRDYDTNEPVLLSTLISERPNVVNHRMDNYLRLLKYDMIRSLRSYVTGDYYRFGKEISDMKSRIDGLERSREKEVRAAQGCLSMAEKFKEDPISHSEYLKEENVHREKAAALSKAIDDHRGRHEDLEEHTMHSQQITREQKAIELFGMQSDEYLEIESKKHISGI